MGGSSSRKDESPTRKDHMDSPFNSKQRNNNQGSMKHRNNGIQRIPPFEDTQGEDQIEGFDFEENL